MKPTNVWDFAIIVAWLLYVLIIVFGTVYLIAILDKSSWWILFSLLLLSANVKTGKK